MGETIILDEATTELGFDDPSRQIKQVEWEEKEILKDEVLKDKPLLALWIDVPKRHPFRLVLHGSQGQ